MKIVLPLSINGDEVEVAVTDPYGKTVVSRSRQMFFIAARMRSLSSTIT